MLLLEYDRRFEKYGENFVFYNYKDPLNFPPEKLQKNSFDLVAADPPFLSKECLQLVAETIHHLAKDKVLLCTGQCCHMTTLHRSVGSHDYTAQVSGVT